MIEITGSGISAQSVSAVTVVATESVDSEALIGNSVSEIGGIEKVVKTDASGNLELTAANVTTTGDINAGNVAISGDMSAVDISIDRIVLVGNYANGCAYVSTGIELYGATRPSLENILLANEVDTAPNPYYGKIVKYIYLKTDVSLATISDTYTTLDTREIISIDGRYGVFSTIKSITFDSRALNAGGCNFNNMTLIMATIIADGRFSYCGISSGGTVALPNTSVFNNCELGAMTEDSTSSDFYGSEILNCVSSNIRFNTDCSVKNSDISSTNGSGLATIFSGCKEVSSNTIDATNLTFLFGDAVASASFNVVSNFTILGTEPTRQIENSWQDNYSSTIDDITTEIGKMKIVLEDNIAFTVGSAADFTTLGAAIAECAKYTTGASGYKITINIETGTVMTEQITIDGIDLGFVNITSTDSSVSVDKNSLTVADSGFLSFVRVKNRGVCPNIGVLFSMINYSSGLTVGLFLTDDSKATISLYGKGFDSFDRGVMLIASELTGISRTFFRYSETAGIYADNSVVKLYSLDCHGIDAFSENGVIATNGSRLSIRAAVCTNTVHDGIYISGGSIVSAHNSTGTLSQTMNTITEHGIIFKNIE